MNDVKQKILKEIENNVPIFRTVSSERFRIRCPFCGDSQKNTRECHLYLKCSSDPSEPILYKCFKCSSKGKVNSSFLEKLGIKMDELSSMDKMIFNKLNTFKPISVDIISGIPNKDSPQLKYIEHRLGEGLSLDDYDKFKIIWNMDNVFPYITDNRVRNTIPSNTDSISFLSEDKSHLLTRFFDDNSNRWRKVKIISSSNRIFYTIKSTFDLFTKDKIVVNIAEGIFDVISAYKNFNDGPNSLFLALLGSDYENGVLWAIDNGIVGSNVTLKIYMDNDVDELLLKRILKGYKWIFGNIIIYKNILNKDIGYPIDKIKLVSMNI